MQNMVGDTLKAVLGGHERRAHELYEAEKNSLLYKLVLTDNDGDDGMIRRLMDELTIKASDVIEEEEKAKRRQMQMQAATQRVEEDEEDGGEGGDRTMTQPGEAGGTMSPEGMSAIGK